MKDLQDLKDFGRCTHKPLSDSDRHYMHRIWSCVRFNTTLDATWRQLAPLKSTPKGMRIILARIQLGVDLKKVRFASWEVRSIEGQDRRVRSEDRDDRQRPPQHPGCSLEAIRTLLKSIPTGMCLILGRN